MESGQLSFKQIEACRKSIRRNIKKEGAIWMRLFTYFSKTKKTIGSRMGKGKGSHAA
jgi:large subunit ribosomal protein L16